MVVDGLRGVEGFRGEDSASCMDSPFLALHPEQMTTKLMVISRSLCKVTAGK